LQKKADEIRKEEAAEIKHLMTAKGITADDFYATVNGFQDRYRDLYKSNYDERSAITKGWFRLIFLPVTVHRLHLKVLMKGIQITNTIY
jgi:hypothetical protein